jgi:hypothetical protein
MPARLDEAGEDSPVVVVVVVVDDVLVCIFDDEASVSSLEGMS